MTEVKHFTIEDVTKFVFDQPDDRQVNFSENKVYSVCGCLMTHIAKANEIDFWYAGFDDLVDKQDRVCATFERSVVSYCPNMETENLYTYKEIKDWFRLRYETVVKNLGL